MRHNQLLSALIISTYACIGFSATLSFQSVTPDKELDGVHTLKKVQDGTYQSENGKITYHKTKSVKKTALIPGELTYEGTHQINLRGKPDIIVHYVGLIHKDGSEHGTYVKYDLKRKELGHGHYQYLK